MCKKLTYLYYVKKALFKYLFIVFIILMHALSIRNDVLCGMGDNSMKKKSQIYEYNGQKIVADVIYWTGDFWSRGISSLAPGIEAYNRIEDAYTSITLLDLENYRRYDRIDLVYYCDGLNNGFLSPSSYRREWNESKIYVTDDLKKLDKPYIKLGTFTVGGRVPSNWKKVKSKIQTKGSGFGCDAVVVEKVETLTFKQEDYLPITEFRHPQYVLYTCVAVVYEENAYIPDYLKVFVTENDFYFPYEEIEEFTVDYKTTTDEYDFWQDIRKIVYDRYKADAVRIIKREELSKGGLFSKGMTRYHCIAIRFDDKIKKQFVIHPDTDIEKLMETKVKY